MSKALVLSFLCFLPAAQRNCKLLQRKTAHRKMKKLSKVILLHIKLQRFSYSPQRKLLLCTYCRSRSKKENLWQKAPCDFPAPSRMITCQFRSWAGAVCLEFLQLTGPVSTKPIYNQMDWKWQKQFQGVPTKEQSASFPYGKRGKYLFLPLKKFY